ncbi:MAG TPA: DNA cytosine methyltransferase [Lacunisphaera sp.]
MSKPTSARRPKVIDLFAGVGGLSLGAARAGFDVALAVEWDRRIAAAHVKNFPETRHANLDVGKLTGAELLKLAGIKPGELDGLIGGPPCQGFSSIGKKNAGDNRNRLFVKFFELVKEIRPSFFLAENVPGILNGNYSDLRKEALELVNEYQIIGPLTVCAGDYGAPTSRTRVIYFGSLRGIVPEFSAEDFAPPRNLKNVTVKEALQGIPKKIKPTWLTDAQGWRKVRHDKSGDFWDRVRGMIPLGIGDPETKLRLTGERRVSGFIATDHSRELIRRYGALTPGERDPTTRSVRLDANGLCPTLRAGTAPEHGSFQAVRPIHPSEPRVITPREAARLQGFPDWFRFDETKWHAFRQIGNSVSPIVAERLLSPIYAKITLRTSKAAA